MIRIYTAADQISALQQARKFIENGTPYICWAIERVDASAATIETLLEYVSDGVSNEHYSDTLSEWLEEELIDADICLNLDVTSDLMHQCRLAWVDRMIHELKTNGKLP